MKSLLHRGRGEHEKEQSRTHNDLALLRPRPIAARITPAVLRRVLPHLHLAREAHTRRDGPLGSGAHMMAAERVHALQRLHERVRILVIGAVGVDRAAGRAVDFDAGGPGRRQQVGGRDGEGEDVGGVGVGEREGLEVLFRLRPDGDVLVEVSGGRAERCIPWLDCGPTQDV